MDARVQGDLGPLVGVADVAPDSARVGSRRAVPLAVREVAVDPVPASRTSPLQHGDVAAHVAADAGVAGADEDGAVDGLAAGHDDVAER